MNHVEKARTYIGTPFKHQGRLPGIGLDCAGTVVCALRESGVEVTDVPAYGRIPANGLFLKMVADRCDKVQLENVQVGDFCMFAFSNDPQHIAIVSSLEPLMLIHAYSEVGKVVENSMDYAWLKRLRGCYRLKGK